MQIQFLPFLAAVLGVSSFNGIADSTPFEKPRDNRRFRAKRTNITKSIFGRRWTWNTPHLGANQAAKLEKRAAMDAKAAAGNYAGWCGRNNETEE